jgi:hypothetical protein
MKIDPYQNSICQAVGLFRQLCCRLAKAFSMRLREALTACRAVTSVGGQLPPGNSAAAGKRRSKEQKF